MYFCPHNFRWSRWTRQFYYGSSYKKSNKVYVLWQCALSPAHYRVGERLELFLLPDIGRFDLLSSMNESPRALLHWVTMRWSETLKLPSKNRRISTFSSAGGHGHQKPRSYTLKRLFVLSILGHFICSVTLLFYQVNLKSARVTGFTQNADEHTDSDAMQLF